MHVSHNALGSIYEPDLCLEVVRKRYLGADCKMEAAGKLGSNCAVAFKLDEAGLDMSACDWKALDKINGRKYNLWSLRRRTKGAASWKVECFCRFLAIENDSCVDPGRVVQTRGRGL